MKIPALIFAGDAVYREILAFVLFHLWFNVPVKNYDHVETVS